MNNDSAPRSRPSLLGMLPDELHALAAEHGQPKFRADQLANWLYDKRVSQFSEMTTLPKAWRGVLARDYCIRSAEVRASEAKDNTTKLALRYPDGSVIEAVLIVQPQFRDSPERRTLCVSTQAGCAMACQFCASGQRGLKRNLTPAEIIEQFHAVGDLLDNDQWLTHVVFMGMGEPLHNWPAFVASLRVITSDWGFGMSPRRITVSTVGLERRIRDLADLDIPVHLAISLHAPNDEIRNRLIPTNKAYGGIPKIVEAARWYYERTKRQVTFEYTLVGGVNDRPEHARELLSLVKGKLPQANINLIPMNPVEGSGLQAPEMRDVGHFSEILKAEGLSVHTRKRKGRAIQAACGQLRLKVEKADAGSA